MDLELFSHGLSMDELTDVRPAPAPGRASTMRLGVPRSPGAMFGLQRSEGVSGEEAEEEGDDPFGLHLDGERAADDDDEGEPDESPPQAETADDAEAAAQPQVAATEAGVVPDETPELGAAEPEETDDRGPRTAPEAPRAPAATRSGETPTQPRRRDEREVEAATTSLGNIISHGEGDYTSYNSGTVGSGRNQRVLYSGHERNLTSMTINQILARSSGTGATRGRLFAVGKYQIIPSTLRAAVAAMGLSGREIFNEQMQERIFLEFLLGPTKRPRIHAYLRQGRGTSLDAQYDASQEWASVEVPRGYRTRSGRTSDGTACYYDTTGRANRAAAGSGARVRAALERLRAALAGGGRMEDQEPLPRVTGGGGAGADASAPAPEGPAERPGAGPDAERPSAPRTRLSASVGRRGANRPRDVAATKTALTERGVAAGGDGVDAAMIGGIRQVQRRIGFRRPDGLIEPGRRTSRALFAAATERTSPQPRESRPPQPRAPQPRAPAPVEPVRTPAAASTEDDEPTADVPAGATGDLAALLARPRLDVAQLARARSLIAAAPAGQRAALYRALQAKVQYANQRDNTSRDRGRTAAQTGDVMCNLTSLAMCLQYLGIPNPHPELQYEDALEQVRRDRRLGARTTEAGWGGVARALGAHVQQLGGGVRSRRWWTSHVQPALDSGRAVMCSLTGHIVRVQQCTEAGVVVDDPFGRSTLRAGAGRGWNGSNNRGAGQQVGEDHVLPWAQVEIHSFLWIAAISR